MPQRIRIGRVYEPVDPNGGLRLLVDRLWPRGLRKEDAHLDRWCKDVAPSTELRKFYGHEPARFDEFARRYRAELASPPAATAIAEIRALARKESVLLLTATRDLDASGAAVLAEYLARPKNAQSP